jgi:glycosyltransferase involved in cell wall biosynthesis
LHLVGWQDDVVPYLNAMDVFALPSLFEALPFSVLEAMACGKPVVATDVGGVREIIQDGKSGFLIQRGDTEALVECIQKLADDRGLRERLGRDARELVVKEYSERQMLEKTMDVYRDVIGRMVAAH